MVAVNVYVVNTVNGLLFWLAVTISSPKLIWLVLSLKKFGDRKFALWLCPRISGTI